MENAKEKALDLALSKAVREQAKVWVYEDITSDGDYYVSPSKVEKDDWELLKKIAPDNLDQKEVEETLVEIDDFESLKEGNQVLIGGEEPEQVIRVTSRQITTHRGNKFRRSDGSEWGKDGGLQLTHKVVS